MALVEARAYQRLFQVGENCLKHFYNPGHDRGRREAILALEDIFPSLSLQPGLQERFGVDTIRILNLDLQLLDVCCP